METLPLAKMLLQLGLLEWENNHRMGSWTDFLGSLQDEFWPKVHVLLTLLSSYSY